MAIDEKNKKIVKYILGGLLCCNILAGIAVFELSQNKPLEVNFFDIGQGDAIFITTPARHQILIDGGPNSDILEKLNQEMPFWDKTIDLIILTHPEHDHYAGLLEVLQRYKVENILWSGILRDTNEYKKWRNLLKQENAKIFIAEYGQRIICSVSDTEHCYFDILHPFENLENQETKNPNNTSVVARLVFGENSFLFTGDIYKSVERDLIEQGIYLKSDVLKVCHHGSKTSSAEEFIEIVSPEIAVILAGKDNPYKHPRPETLATLEKFGINILRTDKDGDIKIISDGREMKIRTQF
jgi:competence protein ComEC